MRLSDPAATIRERIHDYRRSGDARALFADSVQSEVDGLLAAAEPADPESPSPAEQERLASARHLLGTLFFLRFDSAPVPSGDLTDLARALAFH
jgi:hypothetical protein